MALELICLGAEIYGSDIAMDERGILKPISDGLALLRNGHRIGIRSSIMSDEQKRFMWNLAFSLTIQNCAVAFKVYYRVHSFITFHGIFMAHGYGLGDESVWKRRTL